MPSNYQWPDVRIIGEQMSQIMFNVIAAVTHNYQSPNCFLDLFQRYVGEGWDAVDCKNTIFPEHPVIEKAYVCKASL